MRWDWDDVVEPTYSYKQIGEVAGVSARMVKVTAEDLGLDMPVKRSDLRTILEYLALKTGLNI